jgi:hypothetical protein
MFLFRVLRLHDNPLMGLYPTDPSAQIQIRDHVDRDGPYNFVRSQFISTMRNLKVALRWVFWEQSSFAVISCSLLNPNTIFDDLSMGHESLRVKSNGWVIKHTEVLLRPFINSSAIIAVFSYDDLVRFNPSPSFANDVNSFVSNCSQVIYRLPQCSYCHLLGHDIGRGHYCSMYWNQPHTRPAVGWPLMKWLPEEHLKIQTTVLKVVPLAGDI